VEELIKYPFNGADFSTRLWKQKDHMLQQLNESITTMLIQGRNPMTLSSDFSKKFGTKEFEAYRLLHTEGSFMMEQGTLVAYKEDGVKKYQILATLDMKTSDICRYADGKTYDVDKAVTGVTYPPLHVFCRSTTVPYYEDSDYSQVTRAARDPVTGKSYEVPADMNYKDWHKKYIESNPKAVLEEKKWKNRYSDKKQFDRYKTVLGKDLDENSLDDFQNLKYTNTEEWNLTKYNYKLQNSVKSHTVESLRNNDKLQVAESKYTGYLFNPSNEKGYPKGKAITSRLGYDDSNYMELDKLIKSNIGKFPAINNGSTDFGEKIEVNMVLKGLTGRQAKVKAGIMIEKDSDIPKLTTLFIDRLKESD
jgi:SPP1 gp7 family putative phage head morphogenesis protein